ncbi:acyltransferase [Vibrio makurazakiensis]|uniref:acyltransferase family protein n=1 Tax=Vibrio makurazakiensis TaxID=2910250 RepID=UPI003D0BFA6F
MSKINYRPDIDGLRAIAVIAVVIFHIDPLYLPGGFLGVDIFFVISGFLITSIIYKDVEKGTFSYKYFYIRRAKRIFPPLFFMVALVLAVGYVVLLPYDFYKVAISALSVLFFASNMQYSIRTGDYFSSDSSEWPLLHTWSLSVEEQYYFILPILLVLIFKFIRNRSVSILVFMACISFVLAECMSRSESFSAVSYYLILSRMGELLLGSILAILKYKELIADNKSNVLSFLSSIIVLFLMFYVDKSFVFPGFWALALCLPIFVILNSRGTVVNKLLSHRYLVYVGLLSYSIYLFHWPVLAFFRYVLNTDGNSSDLSFSTELLAVLVIIFISLLSYYVIEKPARFAQLSSLKITSFYFVLPSTAVALVCTIVVMNNGLPERYSSPLVDANYQFNHIDKGACPSLVNLDCRGGKLDGEKKIVFYGNSHAEHYFKYVSLMAEKFDYKVSLFASGGCNMNKNTSKCKMVNDAFIDAQPSADLLLIAFRWDSSYKNQEILSSLEALVSRSVEKGQRVVVLAQPPLLNENPAKLFNCKNINISCSDAIELSDSYPIYNDEIKKVVLNSGGEFFDPFKFVSNVGIYSEQERLFYSDRDHLSVYGNEWLFSKNHWDSSQVIFQ